MTGFTRQEALADTTPEQGGRSGGFRPHDLPEAALANGVCLPVRVAADRPGEPGESVFTSAIALDGDLKRGPAGHAAARRPGCPVRKTLSRKPGVSGRRRAGRGYLSTCRALARAKRRVVQKLRRSLRRYKMK